MPGRGASPRPKDVKDLDAWREAIALCKAVYGATKAFPREEAFGLTSQMRRAAVAVASNLAEGHGRGTRRDYRQFVVIGRGSASELETQVIVAREVGLLGDEVASTLLAQTNRVLRLLNGLARSLASEPTEP